MTQYRQILRLHSQGISQRSIAQSCRCSRNTVAAVLQRASTANLTWPLDVETDADLERLLFPEKQEHASLRRMPDFEKVSKELTRSGVKKISFPENDLWGGLELPTQAFRGRCCVIFRKICPFFRFGIC